MAGSLAGWERDTLAHWANSVLALGNPATHGLELNQALQRAQDLYTARSLPVRMALPVPADCPHPVTGPASALPPEVVAGARRAFLQTAAANAAAHRLYLSSGFTVHHRYDYLTPTP